MAVILPSAVGVSCSNWKYKSRTLNETFHKSAPGLQSVQQRIKISVCEGGEPCNLFVVSESVILILIPCSSSKHLCFRLCFSFETWDGGEADALAVPLDWRSCVFKTCHFTSQLRAQINTLMLELCLLFFYWSVWKVSKIADDRSSEVSSLSFIK